MKMKDDYANMAKTGKAPEERRVGSVVSSLLNRGVQGEGVPMKFELYVGPLSKKDILDRYKEYAHALSIYSNACTDYESRNPRKSDDNILEWLEKQNAELKPNYSNEINALNNIKNSINKKKNELFLELSTDFKGLMYNLRSNVLQSMIAKNIVIADGIANHTNEDLRKGVIEMDGKLSKINKEYLVSPTQSSILESLEGLQQEFFANVGRPIMETDKDIKFMYEVFTGKIGSSYFMNNKEFFNAFDWCSKGDSISFDINGALEGEYKLTKEPRLTLKEADIGNYYTASLFSPIAFRIELPKRHADTVGKTFSKIKEKHKDKVVSVEDLQAF